MIVLFMEIPSEDQQTVTNKLVAPAGAWLPLPLDVFAPRQVAGFRQLQIMAQFTTNNGTIKRGVRVRFAETCETVLTHKCQAIQSATPACDA